MRQYWTKFVHALYTLAILSLLPGCQDLVQEYGLRQCEVGIYAGGVQTRTEMLSDGLSAKWVDGDELAVWARESSGTFFFTNKVFTTYGVDDGRGFFTSALDQAMPEGDYTYYCTYPVPQSANGTEVTFNLPSVQDGKVTGGADIMIADPVTYGALTPLPEIEDHTGMSMSMNRMTHQFRFYIPEDDTVLGNASIVKILLDFPKNVAGTVKFDMSDPAAPGELSNSTGSMVLQLARPLEVSVGTDYDYACVSIVPASFSSGDILQLKAYTEDKIVLFDPVNLRARTFAAGHSTPVSLKVKSIIDYPYILNFKISENNLGENPHTVTFEAPKGCVWPETGTNKCVYSPGREISVGETVSFKFEDKTQYMAFSGATIKVAFESDHAITSAVSKLAAFTIDGDTDLENFSAKVPYLFYEDFSTLVVYDGNYKDGAETSVDGASKAAKDLSAYGLPAGWSGARTGCDAAGTAILIGARVDYVIAGATRSYGRLESPELSALTSAADVRVTFRYGGSKSGNKNFYPVGVCGYAYGEGLLNGYASQFMNEPSWTGISGINTIPDIPTSGNASSLSKTMTYDIKGCDQYCRLSWHVAGMGTTFIGNGLQWMYIDDVKVQIIK